jgi:hypothetical protein
MRELFATAVLDELLAEIGGGSGPRERVIAVYGGKVALHTGKAWSREAVYARADAAAQELRKTWGPSANPNRVDDGILSGCGDQLDESEFDCFFALFHRDGFWGYVRLRRPEPDTTGNDYLRLILGVIKDSRDDVA